MPRKKTKTLTNVQRDVEHYLGLPYHFNLYRDEGAEGPYWAVEVAELRGCAGHGATPDEAMACIRESMRYWLEDALEAGDDIPKPLTEAVVSGKFLLRLPKTVHRDLIKRAEQEGSSLNAWAATILAKFGT